MTNIPASASFQKLTFHITFQKRAIPENIFPGQKSRGKRQLFTASISTHLVRPAFRAAFTLILYPVVFSTKAFNFYRGAYSVYVVNFTVCKYEPMRWYVTSEPLETVRTTGY